MRQNETLTAKTFPEIGWLAPDGKYYPGERGGNWLHMEVAEAIIREFFSDSIEGDPMALPMSIKDFPPFTGVYAFLWSKGFVKVDMKEVYPDEDLPQAQIDTLFDLYSHKASGYLSDMKESIRKTLVKNGLGFLSLPGEN